MIPLIASTSSRSAAADVNGLWKDQAQAHHRRSEWLSALIGSAPDASLAAAISSASLRASPSIVFFPSGRSGSLTWLWRAILRFRDDVLSEAGAVTAPCTASLRQLTLDAGLRCSLSLPAHTSHVTGFMRRVQVATDAPAIHFNSMTS